MLKAVLFDLFETLVTESRTRPAGVSSLAAVLGCDRDPFRREWKLIRPSVVAGRLTFCQALQQIVATLGGHADESTLEHLRDERIRIKAEPFATIDPDVLAMARNLCGRGLRLATISNCFAEDVTEWPRSALAPYFDAAVFSFQAGVAKPDPAIFLETTRRLGVAPAATLFVGDGMNDELEGAEHAGLRAAKALWFVRRWPHFHDAPCPHGTLDHPDELPRLVARMVAHEPPETAGS